MDWISDHVWETWLIAAVALGALELVSLDLVLAMLAGRCRCVGMVAAVLGAPFALQVVLALAAAVGLLGVIRPSVVSRLHGGPDLRTGPTAAVGTRATVLRELGPQHAGPGQARRRGVDRRARTTRTSSIEGGAVVDVVQIKGATAYVLRDPADRET